MARDLKTPTVLSSIAAVADPETARDRARTETLPILPGTDRDATASILTEELATLASLVALAD